MTCSDCHDSHGLTLKAPGDLVCAQCHQPERYDTERYHHHPSGSEGVSCIACHMPRTLYMVVDARADHSLRIPRPDLTRKIGTPNACNGCYTDRTATWAEQAILDWYGETISRRPHFGEVLQAGRTGAPDADARLLTLAADTEQPGIARATALSLVNSPLDAAQMGRLRALLKDPNELVRAAALGVLEQAEPRTRLELAWPLLEDAVLAVRIEAARVLAPLLAGAGLTEDQRARLVRGLDEYRATQLANAERPESHLNLGLLDSALQRPEVAEHAYRTALRLDPNFAPAYVNLADLYRALGRDTDGEAVLQQGLKRLPDAASLHHALGLLRVRQGQIPAAVESLARATRLAPENARYAYVHALALERVGQPAEAIVALRAALQRHPNDRDIQAAILRIARSSGDREKRSN